MDTDMPHTNQPKYDDNFPTCAETFSTLRIFADEVSAAEITDTLGIAPTESFIKGQSYSKGLVRKAHGWFYSTEKLINSKDTRRHIDLILEILEGKGDMLKRLHQRGCKSDIMSYFSSHGQGGPALWPHQMLKLGKLGIEVWWDIYFDEED
jgi:Domain of unknown function (DUF4279)